MSVIGRIAARRMGTPAPSGTVPETTFDHAPTRLLIAPVNYAGQGTAWARAVELADPSVCARNMAIDVPGGFSFTADLVVPVGTYHNGIEWQQRQLAAARTATHVLVEAEEPPFGRLLGRSLARQVQALEDAGVNVAFMGHGTDVRLPSRHIRNNPTSYYLDDSVYLPRAEQLAARNIDFITGTGRPLFVSTPDLLVDVPEATWCPVVVDLGRWRVERAPRDPALPLRVAHAPSVAAYKGTPDILPVLEKLQAEGIVEFELLQGIPSAQMPAAFARADVVLDQFRSGAFGVAACEAMAAGCVVIGQVSQQARDSVRAQTGRALPIIDATPATLESMLRTLAVGDLAPLREDARAYVTAVHDGRRSAHALLSHWLKRSASTSEREADRESHI